MHHSKGGGSMRFRKKDYIIFYVIFVIIFVINLRSPVMGSFLPIVIGTIVPALVLGTITNLLFKRRIV